MQALMGNVSTRASVLYAHRRCDRFEAPPSDQRTYYSLQSPFSVPSPVRQFDVSAHDVR